MAPQSIKTILIFAQLLLRNYVVVMSSLDKLRMICYQRACCIACWMPTTARSRLLTRRVPEGNYLCVVVRFDRVGYQLPNWTCTQLQHLACKREKIWCNYCFLLLARYQTETLQYYSSRKWAHMLMRKHFFLELLEIGIPGGSKWVCMEIFWERGIIHIGRANNWVLETRPIT